MAALFPSEDDAEDGQSVSQQANEAHMILGWLRKTSGGPSQHNNPAVRMWRGFEDGLEERCDDTADRGG